MSEERNDNERRDEERGHSLPPLNLPPADLRISRQGRMVKVYDPLRHRDVALTPEEYVRQSFVAYLIGHLHYPQSVVANEVQIELNDTRRRCDTVVFGAGGLPLMIVEYKAPHVAITQDVFDQIVRYNMTLRSQYLVVSNGIRHYCCRIDYHNNTYHFISRIPDYRDIVTEFSSN